MKIGILGSGVVGQQLGLGFLKLGHEVKIGTRDPGKLKDWLSSAGKNGSAGSFKDAAAFGEVLVLAVLGEAVEAVVKAAGPSVFADKAVIDAMNPLDFSKGMPPRLVSAPGLSLGEKVQKLLPGAKVVKAFNTISALIMCDPRREEGVPDLFIAGNDAGAKEIVSGFALKWGWASVVDLGDIEQSYLLEAFGMLWVQFGVRNDQWTHAFKLLRK